MPNGAPQGLPCQGALGTVSPERVSWDGASGPQGGKLLINRLKVLLVGSHECLKVLLVGGPSGGYLMSGRRLAETVPGVKLAELPPDAQPAFSSLDTVLPVPTWLSQPSTVFLTVPDPAERSTAITSGINEGAVVVQRATADTSTYCPGPRAQYLHLVQPKPLVPVESDEVEPESTLLSTIPQPSDTGTIYSTATARLPTPPPPQAPQTSDIRCKSDPSAVRFVRGRKTQTPPVANMDMNFVNERMSRIEANHQRVVNRLDTLEQMISVFLQ